MTPPENSLQPKNRNEWRTWLAANHARPDGLWLIAFKKSASQPTFTFEEAIEEALCFGWIDSKPRKLDDARTMLWFAPRKPRSGWSKINKVRLRKMIEAGRMASPGQAKIDAAQKDGCWNLLDAVDALHIPDDLAEEFAKYKMARVNFEKFPPSTQRGILEWIVQAKRPETRTQRIQTTARLAEANERANQWKPKK